jgi:hypothetical protein
MLPMGNTTAEYLVIGKDGNRSTAGPVTLVVAPPYTAPTLPNFQPPQNITDTQQPFTIPPPTGVNSTDPYNTTVTIAKNGTNGTLEPLIPGLKPGDSLTPQQLEELGKDPNNLPLVIVYNVSNENGSDTSTGSLEITFPPLSPALSQLQPTVYLSALNGTGRDATGYVPDELAIYSSMFIISGAVVPCNQSYPRSCQTYNCATQRSTTPPTARSRPGSSTMARPRGCPSLTRRSYPWATPRPSTWSLARTATGPRPALRPWSSCP